jgi:hypothetical protein
MTATPHSPAGSKSHSEVDRYEGAGAPEVVYSVQFSRDEIRAIRHAARADRVSTADWIRQAAFERAASHSASS